MRSFTSAALLGLAAVASAAPVSVPNNDGFPKPNAQQLLKIEQAAGGTLSNAPPPPSLSKEGITNFQLIAFNELFEVAFFGELLSNITNNVPGFETPNGMEKQYLIDIIANHLAVEELHAINANNALQHFNVTPILPCQYNFPVTTLPSAIALAATFTDVVLGTLQDVSQIFSANADNGPVRAVASVIGEEGEQEGFYRLLSRKLPSEKPFLTTSTRDFAFSALQAFVVPGSCPNANTIPLTAFPLLTLLSNPQPRDSDLTFSVDLSALKQTDCSSAQYAAYAKGESLSLVYLSGQNLPVVEDVAFVGLKGSVLTFSAPFPFQEDLLVGLTVAAVTNAKGPFASAQEVKAATLFAPALIEVD